MDFQFLLVFLEAVGTDFKIHKLHISNLQAVKVEFQLK